MTGRVENDLMILRLIKITVSDVAQSLPYAENDQKPVF